MGGRAGSSRRARLLMCGREAAIAQSIIAAISPGARAGTMTTIASRIASETLVGALSMMLRGTGPLPSTRMLTSDPAWASGIASVMMSAAASGAGSNRSLSSGESGSGSSGGWSPATAPTGNHARIPRTGAS